MRDVDLGSGVALDIGAHIGGVSVALAVDNPEARVIAVEALSENVALLALNVERNGVADRVTALHAAATKPGRRTATVEWNFDSGEAGQHHRFIANAHGFKGGAREKVKAVSLDSLADGEIAFAKVDCELCEYDFLASPAVSKVKEFRGEYHAGATEIEELLSETHHVTTVGAGGLGHFQAVRR